jgi:uncharacterized protein involved in exopolysaccharide biosynthesis
MNKKTGFSEILDFLKSNLKTMLKCGMALALVAAVYAMLAQKEYQSMTKVLPEAQSGGSLGRLSGMAGMAGLAGLAGIDLSSLGGGTESLRPELFPNILESAPYGLYMLKQSVYISETQKVQTIESYLTEKGTHFWTPLIEKIFDNSETIKVGGDSTKILNISRKQELLIEDLNDRIVISIDRKTGIVTIETEMPDPVLAATVARLTVDYLKDYVIDYRTDKQTQQVEFLKGRYAEGKRRYQSAEMALANYRDANRSLFLQTAKVAEQRMQADFLFAQSVYNDLTRQLEQAKIRLQEETPVFKLLTPPQVPLKKSYPKRTIMVLAAFFVGFFGSFFYLFIKKISAA